ncbi:MAG: leucyl aminopeptidase [Solirubrobacteraceae bacterium]|nr:leucyl aminopeptidase [Solirubrobacteraceae bacterium]
MKVSTLAELPTEPDTVILAVAGDAAVDERFARLVDAAKERREVRTKAGHLATLHDADGTRVVVVGLGEAEKVTAEALRVAAAQAYARATEVGAETLHWVLPNDLPVETAVATGAIVEGTVLRSWSYDAKRKGDAPKDPKPEALVIVGGDEAAAGAAAVVANAVNWARVQQHEPPNVLTPTELGRRALAIAEDLSSPHLDVQVEGEAFMREQGMGALLAVSQGSDQEAALITAHYKHPDAKGPRIALVGKAVTFDTGGISIKPGARMHEMKYDMTGGAVVLGALRAVAELDLPLDLVVVVGATENMPDAGAYKPGDIITSAEGLTIEITNTDAEGRLVLADCLWHARQQGAEVLVDVATLTGAVVVALGSTHAGLVANDDVLAGELLISGDRTGELAWRLPLHAEYAKLMNSPDADLVNGSLERKAGSITAGYFLSRFAGDAAWGHLDIAGTGWGLGRAYAARGGSAYGLRLLVDWLEGRSKA